MVNKNNLNEEHCPYCKRHCSLNNPHCSKGKGYAKKKYHGKKKEEKNNVNEIETSIKTSDEKIEERLVFLFQECSNFMQTKVDTKIKKKRYVILSLLIEKGNMTKSQLNEETKYEDKVLDKTLRKMSKKGYIIWKKEEYEDMISITDSALLLWNTIKSKENSINFSALDNGEKEYLEKLLRKLCKSWKQSERKVGRKEYDE